MRASVYLSHALPKKPVDDDDEEDPDEDEKKRLRLVCCLWHWWVDGFCSLEILFRPRVVDRSLIAIIVDLVVLFLSFEFLQRCVAK